jgi:hypothetical protein
VPTSRRVRGRRAPGPPLKSGARALARHLAAGTLDGRTWIAKALRDIRQELADDAGGLDRLSARELLLLDRCAAGAIICMSIESHVFSTDKPITDAGELLPVLRRGYVSHVQSLSRMLQALGLRPDPTEKGPSLHEYLEMRSRESEEAASAQPPAPESAAAAVPPKSPVFSATAEGPHGEAHRFSEEISPDPVPQFSDRSEKSDSGSPDTEPER